ncbi:hypothetical protein WMW72_24710 [Paenibacillus filicis]|uniref:Uncharacterized protein n=1 Tax=Paenibacillus filicis TaxID=669464 RepID=A0ABU9DQI3_9BACL
MYGPWWPGGEGALGNWRRELEAQGCAVTVVPAERSGTDQGGAVYAVTS